MNRFVNAFTVNGNEYSANTTICLTFADGEHIDISLNPMQAVQMASSIFRVVKPEDYVRMTGHKEPYDPHIDH